MIIRSKTPLRLGLAGGGTDVSPFCDEYGGCVLNVTINLFSYCTIIPTEDGKIVFEAKDRQEFFESESVSQLPLSPLLILHRGIYNRIVRDFHQGQPLSFRMITYSDAPAGSGLGTSSTMVVTILKAYQEWLNLPLGNYDLARLAYEIERQDLQLFGGKQDQYAATFGGLNYMEFYADHRVIVNPLKLKKSIRSELENSLLLYYTGTSRDSGKIIEEQTKAIHNETSLEAMFAIKKQTYRMKEAVLKGDFNQVADCLHQNWLEKKKTASVITNPKIEEIYRFCMDHGAKACKISGAGGGGFLMIFCDGENKYDIMRALNERHEGQARMVEFVDEGSVAWTVKEETK